jgi:tetratricopeptide (TPR) repeat protein
VEIVWGISSIQSHICQVLNLQGRLKQAYEIGEQAAKLAEESGDVYTRAQAYANFGYSCACIGFIEKATEYLSKSYSYCERLKLESYIGFTSFFLAEALFELGRFRKAKAHYKKAVSAFKDINAWPSFRNLNRVGIIRARMRLTGERPDVSRLEELAVEMKLKMYRGWIYRYISEVTSYHAETPGSEAFEWAEKAIAADAENKMAYHLGKDYLTYAGLLKKRGQSPEARDYLGKAIEIFRSCGAGARADRLTPELEVT